MSAGKFSASLMKVLDFKSSILSPYSVACRCYCGFSCLLQ